MTTGNAPTMPIVRQIELITERRDNALLIAERKSGDDREGWLDDAAGYDQVIASLEKLAAIEKPVPVEPFRRFRGVLKPVDRGMWVNGPCDYYHDAEVDTRIDTLQSALQLAREELRTDWYLQAKRSDEMAKAWEREARELKERAEKAEATNRRMVELLKRPPDEYLNISDIWSQSCDDVEGCHLGHPTQQHYFADLLHKAISAELLKEVEK